jgi:fimbrial chaperone protein
MTACISKLNCALLLRVFVVAARAVFWTLLLGGPAAASSFGVAPTLLELRDDHRIEVLTMHNQGDAPALMQVRVVAWSQTDGEDHYAETREILATPPVFQLPAGADQIIRVALRREPDNLRELSYRVFVQEVPPAAPLASNGLKVALQLSVPVFVAPRQASAPSVLQWAARADDALLQISAANPGNLHVQIQRFELAVPGVAEPLPVTSARYVLPGSEVRWPAKLASQVGTGADFGIRGISNLGEFTATATLIAP